MKPRIGIFGGSFDPVHHGHLRAAKSFLESGLIHRLLVLCTPNPPHKPGKMTPMHHRMEMLKRAFAGMDDVVISDLEKNLSSPSYTLQTIRYLKSENPESAYYLCLGEDSIEQFHNWYHYREILEEVPLLVAERPGFDSSRVDPEILIRTIFIDHKPVDISSTEIRKSGDTTELLPDTVRSYIEAHQLYRDN